VKSAHIKERVRLVAIALISSITVGLNSIAFNTFALLTSPTSTPSLPALMISQANPTPSSNPEPADPDACRISDSFTSEVKAWESDICRWSKEQQLDPDLIATIMQIESCGNNWAVSSTGVKGLFQVTGANLRGRNGFDPNSSAAAGPGEVLKNELKATNGNIRAAMAGYNGGGWARQYISGELTRNQFLAKLRTHRYWNTQAKALAKANEVERYAQWADIYFEGKENKTETLNIWLNLGGYRLCNDAAVQLGMAPRFSKPGPGQPIVASDIENKQ
jgi:soluble lytic murein transglycosylase-like protein